MDTYTHGHQESVLSHHGARTVENSAAFLVPHLSRGSDLLDMGCGPGSITIELAQLVDPGRVVGIDIEPDVLDIARRQAAKEGVSNVEFQEGSAYDLGMDTRFDIAYAHQVLQHLTDPVRALKQLRKSLRPGGVLGVRDADYGGMIWTPEHPLLTRWLELYHQVTAQNGAEADAGRHLLGWVQSAGFTTVNASTSTWTYADDSSRQWWGQGWSQRALESSFARQAIEYGLSDRTELEAISAAWQWWSDQSNGFFAIIHTDVIAS